jgi:hypothetical protein
MARYEKHQSLDTSAGQPSPAQIASVASGGNGGGATPARPATAGSSGAVSSARVRPHSAAMPTHGGASGQSVAAAPTAALPARGVERDAATEGRRCAANWIHC